MTADGVAAATVTAEYLGVALGLALASRSLGGHMFRGGGASAGYRRYLELNFPLFVRTTALMLAFAFVTAMGARFGSVVLAANALLLNFLYFAAYALDGFANAAESLVGRAVGRGDAEALRRSIHLSGLWTLGVAATLSTLFAAGGYAVIDLMTSQPELREVARTYLPWLVVTPLVGCWAYLFDGVFVGATLSRPMRDTMLFAAIVVYLPAWYLLRPFGNHGLWLAFTLFLGARGLAQWWVLRRLRRRGAILAT
jgi:MATE family multidrug resistance protein